MSFYRRHECGVVVGSIGVVAALALFVAGLVFPPTYQQIEGRCVVEYENNWTGRTQLASTCDEAPHIGSRPTEEQEG